MRLSFRQSVTAISFATNPWTFSFHLDNGKLCFHSSLTRPGYFRWTSRRLSLKYLIFHQCLDSRFRFLTSVLLQIIYSLWSVKCPASLFFLYLTLSLEAACFLNIPGTKGGSSLRHHQISSSNCLVYFDGCS